MQTRILDDFSQTAEWMPVASGQAALQLAPDHPIGPRAPAAALRLDFDFKGSGGFVVARRPLAFGLPDAYALRLRLRGAAPSNKLELKLVDPSGANVWRWQQDPFDFTDDWQDLTIKGSQMEFAWGPAGGGAPKEVGAVELAVVAGPGGAGTLWIADLCLEDRTIAEAPAVSASSARSGQAPACVLDGRIDTAWRPNAEDTRAWIALDFHAPREYGGLILRWAASERGVEQVSGPRGFVVQAGDDGADWRDLYTAEDAAGPVSYVYLPGGESRRLRLLVNGHPGLTAIEVQPYDFSRDLDGFFQQVAARSERGRYPRWLCREQTYWTPVDIPDGAVPALLNEDGMLEVYRGGWSLEPVLFVDGALITWADAEITQSLEGGDLPIPSSHWRAGDLALCVSACAVGGPGAATVQVRYRVENLAPEACRVRLFVALRPFQVSPPWQRFGDIGGVVRVSELRWESGLPRPDFGAGRTGSIGEHAAALWVDGCPAVTASRAPDAFGVAGFDQGPITDYLARGEPPQWPSVRDPFGHASAALAFDLDLAPNASDAIDLAVPLDPPAHQVSGILPPDPQALARAASQWTELLGQVRFDLPDLALPYAQTCRSAAAQILLNRDGPALQPGPRRYTRSWIRDGAGMAAALLRLDLARPARDFIRWYAQFQAPDGNVPCCVDQSGPDWLPEHDSHGQLVFAVAEYSRFTGDLGLARELWPACLKAIAYLEALRAQRLTEAYLAPDRRACYGLLPESVSHEGYLAHPVHAYWDDFWALRGLKDAAWLAEVLKESAEARRLTALRDDFADTLHASLAHTMADRGIDYLPGSVEWADADATAVANALTLVDETHRLPPAALAFTFDQFLERFRAMHGDKVPWTNYTPYEIRVMGALIRLGRRDDAHELARFFLAERRPPAWNQWPEIAWRNPRAPGHQGDLPHTWIAAEYILAFRDWFAYEREADQALVVAAGIPHAWLMAGPVAVSGLPTWYGRLDLRLSLVPGGVLEITLGGDLRLPPGGIWLAPPLARPPGKVLADGYRLDGFTQAGGRLAILPERVTLAG